MLLYGWFSILASLCVFTNTVVGDGFPCKKRDGLCGCVFKNASGQNMEIKMSALDNKDGTPFFPKIPGKNSYWSYNLNLCTGFTIMHPAGCSDVTGCQTSTAQAFAMGKPESIEFGNYMVNKSIFVTYHADNKDATTTRFTIINLICKQDAEKATAKFVEEIDKLTKGIDYYYFDITSKHLCPVPSTHSGKSNSKGLSTGSIIVIIFFVVLFVYLVSGILFMKYNRGATGKEIIPNIGFWSSIPGLIKDGCVFFGRKMGQLCKREGYDEI